jgi:hypothetical protein
VKKINEGEFSNDITMGALDKTMDRDLREEAIGKEREKKAVVKREEESYRGIERR